MVKAINKLLWRYCFDYMQHKRLRRIFARNRTLPCWCV